MIANARMYSVDPQVADLWRALLSAVIHASGSSVALLEHPAPAPLEALWQRPDLGAVFMCGLPYSRATPQPILIAAPVPSPVDFADTPRYWSHFVVRRESGYETVADTFGHRVAFTVPGSQSGYVAALSYFMDVASDDAAGRAPLFDEIMAPTVTPLGALSAVIRGEADIAPLDAYAFHLLKRHRPDLTDQVRVVGQTVATPIPPLVGTSPAAAPLQRAFLDAHLRDATRGLMQDLLIRRFAAPDADSYDILRVRFETALRFWGTRPLAKRTHPAFALKGESAS
jgi:ABC-type phosphate/phosphonate transport system substrate-binding protein